MTAGWKMLVGVALLALAFVAGTRHEGARKDTVIAQMKTDQAAERMRQALAQVNAVDRARAEEQRRINTISEIANHANIAADRAHADARTADARAERLRQRVATLLREHDARNSAAASGSQSTETAGVVLADVFSRVDAAAGELAESLDAANVKWWACKRSYDALTSP